VKEWQRALKELAGSGRLRNTLLLLAGSNLLDIKFSSERLPGRRGKIFNPDITILPLDFSEFLKLVRPEFKQKKHNEIFTLHFAEIQKLFEDFLVTGGFLMNINNFYTRGFIPAYIYELYDSWIEGDLHKTGKSDETALRIFERLHLHLTIPVSFYKIAKESGVVSHITIRDYLDILEKMFVLFKTDFFSIEQKRPDFKKNHKIYFFDPFILQVVLAKMEGFFDDAFNFSKRIFLRDEFRPKVAEMLVGAALKRAYFQLYYGNSSLGEIDFVGKAKGVNSFYEVKYQKKLEMKGFDKFKGILNHLTVITRDDLKEEEKTILVPLEIFLGFKKDFII
jgi:predicted AAA+ superfamily ATPase